VAWREDGRASVAQRLGLRARESALTGISITHVLSGGAAEAGGVSARDDVIGCNGWRLRRLDDLPGLLPAGETRLELLISRDQRLLPVTLALPAPHPAAVALALAEAPTDMAARQHWLAA
jgi:predicted metalloprotease with PDZ domain